MADSWRPVACFSGHFARGAAACDLDERVPEADPLPAPVPAHGHHVLRGLRPGRPRRLPRRLRRPSHVPGPKLTTDIHYKHIEWSPG